MQRGREAKDRLKPDPQPNQQDGLVLSPQGRSFLTGCQVANSNAASGDKGDGNGGENNNNGGRDEYPSRGQDAPGVGRRVGSGRVLNRGEREDYDPRRFEVAAARGRGEPGAGGDKYAFGGGSRRGQGREDEMDADPRMRLRFVDFNLNTICGSQMNTSVWWNYSRSCETTAAGARTCDRRNSKN